MLRTILPYLFLCLSLTLGGCVSGKYKQIRVSKRTAPVAMSMPAENASIAASVDTVIVYKSPGSWKKAALWDEYVLTLRPLNGGTVVLQNATLEDSLGNQQACGANPWALEKASQSQLQLYKHMGRQIALGVGLTTLWISSCELVSAAIFIPGEVTVAAALSIVAIPVTVAGHFYLSHKAKKGIETEFNKRRFILPLALPAEGKQASLFFPVSPGPKRLRLGYTVDGKPEQLVMEIKGLENLHLKDAPKSTSPTPVPAK